MPKKNMQHHRACVPTDRRAAPPAATQAEQHERTDAVRHQRFPVGETEIGRDRADRRRENEQEHVIERVRDVEQQRGRAVGSMVRHAGSRRYRRKPLQLSEQAPAASRRLRAAALAASASRGARRAGARRHPSPSPRSASRRARDRPRGPRAPPDRSPGTPGRCAADCPRRRRTMSASKPIAAPVSAHASSSTISASIAPLVPPIASIDPASAGLGVGRRLAVAVERPAQRNRPAFLRRDHHLAARDLGQRQVDQQRRAVACAETPRRSDWCRRSDACRRPPASPTANCRTRGRPCPLPQPARGDRRRRRNDGCWSRRRSSTPNSRARVIASSTANAHAGNASPQRASTSAAPPRAADHDRRGVAVGAAVAQMRRVLRNARHAVRCQPLRFRIDQRARRDRRHRADSRRRASSARVARSRQLRRG